MDQIGKHLLCPAPRGWINLVWEDADSNRDGDAFGVEVPEFAPGLPIKTGARQRCVRQPGDRDVVEDVVAREALRVSVKDARDELIAARVVIEEIRRQADPRFRTSSAVAIPAGTRIRCPFDRRTADARKRLSPRLRDPMAPARRKRPR